MPGNFIERRIRWSGILVGAGLIIQMLTLLWTHPLAFVAFLLIGCPLVAAGILLYLYSLVAHGHATERATEYPVESPR
jgi:F0F1-type ATP synthase assembly protein I